MSGMDRSRIGLECSLLTSSTFWRIVTDSAMHPVRSMSSDLYWSRMLRGCGIIRILATSYSWRAGGSCRSMAAPGSWALCDSPPEADGKQVPLSAVFYGALSRARLHSQKREETKMFSFLVFCFFPFMVFFLVFWLARRQCRCHSALAWFRDSG